MRKLQQIKKAAVTVTASICKGFGAGYISYVKKCNKVFYIKKGTITPYNYKYNNYYFLLIFNVTNVTTSLTLGMIDVKRLRYNVT